MPAGKGDEVPGQPAQDIVFVVRQKPHGVYTREGDDLVATVMLPLRYGYRAGLVSLPFASWLLCCLAFLLVFLFLCWLVWLFVRVVFAMRVCVFGQAVTAG
jgi:hypothetical protein